MVTVNIFLSSQNWAAPRNTFGVRHHVAALYEEVFSNCRPQVYPKNVTGGILVDGLKYLPAVLQGDVNVLTPGYPIVAGALASWLCRQPGLIVHTWKVPGVSDDRLTARANDLLLRRVIDHARAVVVANQVQRRQIEALGVSCPVLFAPVTVDSAFWHPEPGNIEADLANLGLEREGYVLTVGGNDRDERYGAVLSRALGLQYVRATNDTLLGSRLETEFSASHEFKDCSKVLLRPSDSELRALYIGARIVCLATVTRTNPAGLSALVEAMACGAVVAIPEAIAEGYVLDGATGLVLAGSAHVFASRVLSENDNWPLIRQTARRFAERELNNSTVAQRIRDQFQRGRILG